jgi:hypothetical protein
VPTVGEVFACVSRGWVGGLVGQVLILGWVLRVEGIIALGFLGLTHWVSVLLEVLAVTMGEFPVWKVGSLCMPFGLARGEELARFAGGVFSVFGGLYVLKETVEGGIIAMRGRYHHHHHHHEEREDG